MAPILRQSRDHSTKRSSAPRQHRSRSPSFLSDTALRIRLREEPVPSDLDGLPVVQVHASDLSTPITTTVQPNTSPILVRRARVSLPAIPSSYYQLGQGPAPGTIVGIVLGVVLGFVLLVWIIIAIVGNRANAQFVEGDETEIVVRRDGHSSRRSRHTHRSQTHRTHRTRTSRSSSSSDDNQRSAAPPPRRQSPKRQRSERIIVQETRRTESRAPPPPAPPSVSQVTSPRGERVRETITVREQSRASRRVEGDDEVIVEEEHEDIDTTPRRKNRSGSYRTVDPSQYGGGNYPPKDFDRRSSRR